MDVTYRGRELDGVGLKWCSVLLDKDETVTHDLASQDGDGTQIADIFRKCQSS